MLNVRYLALISLFLYSYSTANYDNPDCVVDKNLDPSAPDNYVDCESEISVQLGKTECCNIDTDVGCCEPGGSWKKFQLIGICLGVITVSLAAILIYWFWCRKNKKVARAREYMAQKCYGAQERYCRKQVEARKQQEVLKEQAKEVPAFQLPAESSTDDQTFDKFWQGPMIKS